MTALGGYVTGTRGLVCVVPKTQQGYSLVQSPAPQGEKVAHRSDDHYPGEFGGCPPQSKGGDGRLYQAGVNSALLVTNIPLILVEALTRVLIPKEKTS